MAPASHFRQRLDDPLDTVLRSLTHWQLRLVADRLNLNAPRERKNESLVESLFSSGRSSQELWHQALEVESEVPFNHCVLTICSAEQISRARQLVAKDRPGSPFPVFHSNGVFTLTFEKDVGIEIPEVQNIGGRRARVYMPVSIRHPTIARFNPANSSVIISFPGVTQHKNRFIDYRQAVNEVKQHLADHLGVQLHPIPVRACITSLAEADSERVIIATIAMLGNKGHLKVSTERGVGGSAEELLTDMLPGLDRLALRKAVLKSLRNNTVEALAVSWRDEGVNSKLDFWNDWTQFFFRLEGLRA